MKFSLALVREPTTRPIRNIVALRFTQRSVFLHFGCSLYLALRAVAISTVNSRMLYRLSYWGIWSLVWHWFENQRPARSEILSPCVSRNALYFFISVAPFISHCERSQSQQLTATCSTDWAIEEYKIKKQPWQNSLSGFSVSASTYFPGPLPAKYFRHEWA